MCVLCSGSGNATAEAGKCSIVVNFQLYYLISRAIVLGAEAG